MARMIDAVNACKDFLRVYVHRGDTFQSIKSGQGGCAYTEYSLMIKSDKLHVSRVKNEAVKYAVSLKKVFDELVAEPEYKTGLIKADYSRAIEFPEGSTNYYHSFEERCNLSDVFDEDNKRNEEYFKNRVPRIFYNYLYSSGKHLVLCSMQEDVTRCIYSEYTLGPIGWSMYSIIGEEQLSKLRKPTKMFDENLMFVGLYGQINLILTL